MAAAGWRYLREAGWRRLSGKRAAPGIEPGTSRTLRENHQGADIQETPPANALMMCGISGTSCSSIRDIIPIITHLIHSIGSARHSYSSHFIPSIPCVPSIPFSNHSSNSSTIHLFTIQLSIFSQQFALLHQRIGLSGIGLSGIDHMF